MATTKSVIRQIGDCTTPFYYDQTYRLMGVAELGQMVNEWPKRSCPYLI